MGDRVIRVNRRTNASHQNMSGLTDGRDPADGRFADPHYDRNGDFFDGYLSVNTDDRTCQINPDGEVAWIDPFAKLGLHGIFTCSTARDVGAFGEGEASPFDTVSYADDPGFVLAAGGAPGQFQYVAPWDGDYYRIDVSLEYDITAVGPNHAGSILHIQAFGDETTGRGMIFYGVPVGHFVVPSFSFYATLTRTTEFLTVVAGINDYFHAVDPADDDPTVFTATTTPGACQATVTWIAPSMNSMLPPLFTVAP